MAAPILTTKLYAPLVRPGLVSRPRLVKRLNTGLRGARRLTLISAPAGFGKTTLLSEWICSLKSQISDLKIAWLSLDEGDNDPVRFLVYVVAALQTQVDAGHGVLEALQSPHHPPATASTSPSLAEWMEKLVTALINEISLVPTSLILILDDYHFITARPIHATVAFLLDHLPPNLHVVIGSRSDPPLHLARLRARGQLGELRQSDLRFTLDEAAEFLKQVAQVEFSTSDIAALASRTEGWAAGLQMAALALSGTLAPRARDDIARFIRAFTGSNRYVLDYLVEEVFQRQPESVQTFLLHTSILDELTGSLCNAVSHRADGQATLEQLERANLFIVPLDDERRWYRYHRLFADLLRHRLQLTQPDLAPSLHLRASEWYERAATSDDSGWMAGAIRHAAAARDHARAARLIEQAAQPTLARSEVATFLNWISLLPDEAVRAQPRLRVYQAMALLLDGRSPDTVETILHEAEQANSGNSLAGEAMAIRALSAAYQGDAERSATLARRALELLPEDNILLRGFAIGSLGLSYLWSEDLNAAVRTFEEGARIGEKAGNVMFTVLALRRVGRLRMAQGKLHEARSLFERALELSVDRQGQRLPIAGTVLIAMGYLTASGMTWRPPHVTSPRASSWPKRPAPA